LEKKYKQIKKFTTVPDSAWRSLSGAIYHVEAKFGTSGLTRAQRIARKALSDTRYRVEKWTYPWFGKLGDVTGTTLGGSVSALFSSSVPCDCSD
jgi:hypothetical protein